MTLRVFSLGQLEKSCQEKRRAGFDHLAGAGG